MADCEYEMGGTDGPVCAWSPGACKSWCRSNAGRWAPTALSIFEEVNDGTFAGFGIHIDMLSVPFLRSVLHGSLVDEHVADMHAETMESLGMDGVFGTGIVLGKQRDDLQRGISCTLNVSGLLKPIRTEEDRVLDPPKHVVDAWENWESPKSVLGWDIKTLKVSSSAKAKYILHRMDRVIDDEETPQQGDPQTRVQVIEAISKTMGDDMTNLRMVNSRLFYSFKCSTHPWPWQKRRAFATLLGVLTKNMNGALFTSHVSPNTLKWTFSAMGPQTSCRSGNIHVTLKRPPPNGSPELAWGSSIRTSISIDVDPKKDFDSIGIEVITAW